VPNGAMKGKGGKVPEQLKALVDGLTDQVAGLREEIHAQNVELHAQNERRKRDRRWWIGGLLGIALVFAVIAGGLEAEARNRDDAIKRNNQRGCDFFSRVSDLRIDPREPDNSAGQGIVQAAKELAAQYGCDTRLGS